MKKFTWYQACHGASIVPGQEEKAIEKCHRQLCLRAKSRSVRSYTLSCLQACDYTFISLLSPMSHYDRLFSFLFELLPTHTGPVREKGEFSSRHLLKVKRIWLNLSVKNSCPLSIPLQKDNIVTFKARLITVKSDFS